MRTATFGDGDDDLGNPVVSLAMRLPIATPILPAGIEKAELGELTTDERYAENPSRADVPAGGVLCPTTAAAV